MKRTPLKRTKPMRRVSAKQQACYSHYRVLRKDFLAANPVCEAGAIIVMFGGPDCCTHKATQVHHSMKRGSRTNLVDSWVPVCAACHSYIEDHKSFARQAGLLVDMSKL